MTNASLKKLVFSAPTSPGIYMFKEDGKNIYIGKAANLKSRLRSYLKTADPRIQKMVSVADSLEFKTTESDIEALILESQFIKDFRPKFNIMLRDDKQYFYVGFTDDTFPRLFLTHQPSRYSLFANPIGPFTDGAVLKSMLKFLRKIFPHCTCKNLHNNFCLNYHLGNCIGICCLKLKSKNEKIKVTIQNLKLKEYGNNIKAIKDILNGKKKSLLKDLAKKMSSAAKKEDFETAISLRGKIEGLERIFENARVIKDIKPQENTLRELAKILKLPETPGRIEGYDISNIQGTNATGSMVIFENGIPNKNQYRKFKINRKSTLQPHDGRLNIATLDSPNDTAMLKEVLQRRFNHPEWPLPDLVLIDGGKGQLNAARAAITNHQSSTSTKIPGLKHREPSPRNQIPIMSLAKGKYEIFSTTLEKPISMAKLPPNIRNLIKGIDAEAHRFAINYYRRLHKRKLLR